MTNPRADLVSQIAKAATFAEQADLVSQLDDFDQRQRLQAQAARELDLAGAIVEQTLVPVRTHEFHTAATDWIAEYEPDVNPQAHHASIAEAALWFGRTSPEVRADIEEFGIQAEGFMRREASKHGESANAIYQEGLGYLGFLYRRQAASGLDQIQQTVNPHEDPAATPLPQDVFDNFAPPVHDINAGVVGTETSERNPLIGEIEGAGGGQGAPEKPIEHDEADENSTPDQPMDASAGPQAMDSEVGGAEALGQEPQDPQEAPQEAAGGPQEDEDDEEDPLKSQGSWDARSVAISHHMNLDQFRALQAREAASGLDQIQQTVNPHEDPSPTPLPVQVMFPWLISDDAYGNGGQQPDQPGQGPADVANAANPYQGRKHAVNAADVTGYHHDGAAYCQTCHGPETEECEGSCGPVFGDNQPGPMGEQCSGCGNTITSPWSHATKKDYSDHYGDDQWYDKNRHQGSRYDPTDDPSSWQHDKSAHPGAPSKGTPDDLFPDGVPLRGELTPEQQAWMDRGRKKKGTRKTAGGPSDPDFEDRPGKFTTNHIDDPDGQEFDIAPQHVQDAINNRFGQGAGPVVHHPSKPGTFIHGPNNFWDGPTHVKANDDGTYAFSGHYGPETFHQDGCSLTHSGPGDNNGQPKQGDPHAWHGGEGVKNHYEGTRKTADMYGNSDAPHPVPGPSPANTPGTAPNEHAGYEQGYQDATSGARPTFADASSSVAPNVVQYTRGYQDGSQARNQPQNVPSSLASRTAAQVIYHESYGEVTRPQLAAYRKHNVSPSDHDYLTDHYGEDAHDKITKAVKNPDHHVGGSFSTYKHQDHQEDQASGGGGWGRISSRFVKEGSRRDPEFHKGYGFATKWAPGKPLVSLGSPEFESGVFAGLIDRPRHQQAWVTAHRMMASKDSRFADRMRTYSAYMHHLADMGISVEAEYNPHPVAADGSGDVMRGVHPGNSKGVQVSLKPGGQSTCHNCGVSGSNADMKDHAVGGRNCTSLASRKTAGGSTDLDTMDADASPSATGQTPINGEGQPGPLAGGMDAAAPGGPSPYNGADPFGQPVVPTGQSAGGGGGYVNDIPGGPTDGNVSPATLAFRRRVQASLLQQTKRG